VHRVADPQVAGVLWEEGAVLFVGVLARTRSASARAPECG